MILVSEIKKEAPSSYKTPLQKRVYEVLDELQIPFERVDTEEAITMEDCLAIDERLQMKTVKTLFLCNRQQTEFYLFITSGDKSFHTKDFSSALGIARVSFAPSTLMESMLGTTIGSTTVFSCLWDQDNKVKIVFDKEILKDEWYGCSDSTTTGYMKVKTEDILKKLLPYAHHDVTIIEVQ